MNMNKYYTGTYYGDIAGQLMPDESIIWRGTPKKNAYIINASIKMMPFALIWLLFDGFFIATFMGAGGEEAGSMAWFLIPFFAFHLMPVWIWLGNVLTAGKRWKNTEYAVTDKRIVIRNGLIGYEYQSIYYTEIVNVSLHVGAIDKMLGVGDIYIITSRMPVSKSSAPIAILDVEDPQRVFAIVQQTVMDIQTDIHYPNALRPENNFGYNTQYQPRNFQ